MSTKFHGGQKVHSFDAIFNLRRLCVAVFTNNCNDLSDKINTTRSLMMVESIPRAPDLVEFSETQLSICLVVFVEL